MADRFDKSFSRRPIPAESAAARRPEPPQEEDPLIELARIVSGNPSFDDIVGNRPPQQAPAPTPPARPQPQPAAPRSAYRDLSFDLESELLSDLQSSFDPAARAAAPRQPPQEVSSPRAMRDAPMNGRDSQPPRGNPAPREDFDRMRTRPSQPASPSRPAQPAGRFPEPPDDDDDPYAGAAYAAPPRPVAPPAAPPRAAAAEPDRLRHPGPADFRASGGGYRAGRGRADEAADYDSDDYDDDMEDAAFEEADLDDAGAYADEDELEPSRPRRSRKALITAGIVLAVLIAGGLGAFALKNRASVSGAGPQIIAADEGPTKVQPAAQPADPEADQNNKMIYDRANADTPSQEQLVVPDDGAVDEKPPTNESEGSREISRIILPGAPGSDSSAPAVPEAAAPSPAAPNAAAPDAMAAPGAMDAADAAPEPDAVNTDVGPRKVRTVVVKPDGTIVSSEAAPRGAAAGGSPDMQTAANSLTAPTTDPSAAVVSAPPSNPAPETAAAPAAGDAANAAAAPAKPQKDPSQLAETPAPRPAAPKPVRQAAADPDAGAAAASSAGAGGFVVQVTSQRTEEQAIAAYKNLQRKFPGVLGSRDPDIARADLGAKGVYYRARIGPMASRDEAVNFCESLKSAGGDCIVQKN